MVPSITVSLSTLVTLVLNSRPESSSSIASSLAATALTTYVMTVFAG